MADKYLILDTDDAKYRERTIPTPYRGGDISDWLFEAQYIFCGSSVARECVRDMIYAI